MFNIATWKQGSKAKYPLVKMLSKYVCFPSKNSPKSIDPFSVNEACYVTDLNVDGWEQASCLGISIYSIHGRFLNYSGDSHGFLQIWFISGWITSEFYNNL